MADKPLDNPAGRSAMRVLAIVTSTGEYRDAGYRTGLWLGELNHFSDLMEANGVEVDIASIRGGDVPIDPESLQAPMLLLGGTGKRYKDRAWMDRLRGTRSVAEVSAETYDAIYLTGGHGTMFDFDDEHLAALVADFARQGKVVSAVCHGPNGLVAVEVDGVPLLHGKQVTGYSWLEERLARRDKVVPFSLQDHLTERAARYTTATIPMTEHVVVDGRLVTGQNPTSAKGVARAVLELLQQG